MAQRRGTCRRASAVLLALLTLLQEPLTSAQGPMLAVPMPVPPPPPPHAAATPPRTANPWWAGETFTRSVGVVPRATASTRTVSHQPSRARRLLTRPR